MLLTRVAYAEHAKLSKQRIDQLIDQGMPVTPNGKIDPDAADSWRFSVTDLRKQKLAAEIRLANLKTDEREGSLVPRAAAENFIFEEARKIRDGLIGWVSRSAPIIAAELECEPQLVFAVLDRLIREHLADLAGDNVGRKSPTPASTPEAAE